MRVSKLQNKQCIRLTKEHTYPEDPNDRPLRIL